MRTKVMLRIPTADLDPRDRNAVAAWVADPPLAPTIGERDLVELANDLAKDFVNPTIVTDDRGVTFRDRGEGFDLTLTKCGGKCLTKDLENDRSVLEEVCSRTGWVGYDPDRRVIVVGRDLICACDSAIASDAEECGVCGASVAEAKLPATSGA